MRVLVVTDEHPWPSRTGYRQRLDRVVRTLAVEHHLDLLTVALPGRVLEAPPPDVGLCGYRAIEAGARPGGRLRRLSRWMVSGVPRSVGWRSWTPVREALERSGPAYDVVWFSHAEAWQALGDLLPGAHVVDLDNLNSSLLRHRRDVLLAEPLHGWRTRAVRLAKVSADTVDARRWDRIERRATRDAAVVVVCSDVDAHRLSAPKVQVVANGYDLPADDVATPGPVPDGPILLMVGLLTYPANLDAAVIFGRDVLPRIRDTVPEAGFRVVGRYDDEARVAALRGLEGVTVTGEVPDVAGELRAAAVSVVPVRFGGGTRIKILEALAHRVPVVTTTVGAEGLAVEAGRHLLVADDARAFVAACLQLLDDTVLRAALTEEGHRLWWERYRGAAVAPAITRAVRDATGRQSGP
ncbi:MAG: glycosyltransferase [Marmoricola sp.]